MGEPPFQENLEMREPRFKDVLNGGAPFSTRDFTVFYYWGKPVVGLQCTVHHYYNNSYNDKFIRHVKKKCFWYY